MVGSDDPFGIPSGKLRWQLINGISPFLIGNTSSKGPFSIPMLVEPFAVSFREVKIRSWARFSHRNQRLESMRFPFWDGLFGEENCQFQRSVYNGWST